MPLPSPNKRKPTASEAVEWALYIAKNKITIDIDQRHGGQCWDLPNKLTKMYWGFFTEGNANAMANKGNYKGYDFKIFKNTPDFVPQIGDWAVWAKYNPGHVAIVVGPANKKYFYSVDQNWYTNNWNGSPPYKVKHTYDDGPGGVTHFVRPPYYKSTVKNPEKKNDVTNNFVENKAKVEPRFKEITEVIYTTFSDTVERLDITHYVVAGEKRKEDIKGIYLKENNMFRSVENIYKQRNRYADNYDFPHSFVDKTMTWHCRHSKFEAAKYKNWLIIEVCGSKTETKNEFLASLIQSIIHGEQLLKWNGLKLKKDTLKLDSNIRRIMMELINYDMISDGEAELQNYENVSNEIFKLYNKKDDILNEVIFNKVTKRKIEIKNKPNEKEQNINITNKGNIETKVNVETSKVTFAQALNAQMQKGNPMINIRNGWFSASRSQVSEAMSPTKIWGDSVQKYQMLDLGQYQGLSVEKIDSILKNKGKLSGQGKAFKEACKKYDVNEIYLIAHAFLESGNGTSNFASGRYGIYNFFGINAHDSNPNLAINYAKNKGWTTPAKGIDGGAKFIRENYLNKGKNTLYRMRWNPSNPGTLQYATDINWCKHQAKTIYDLYKKIGSKGIYYIRDKYK